MAIIEGQWWGRGKGCREGHAGVRSGSSPWTREVNKASEWSEQQVPSRGVTEHYSCSGWRERVGRGGRGRARACQAGGRTCSLKAVKGFEAGVRRVLAAPQRGRAGEDWEDGKGLSCTCWRTPWPTFRGSKFTPKSDDRPSPGGRLFLHRTRSLLVKISEQSS